MPAVVLLIILIVVTVVLVKAITDARQDFPSASRPPSPRPWKRPQRPSSPPRRPRKPIDEQRLADHVRKLRLAVQSDLITRDEAVASIIRQADGQLSANAAEELLSNDA